MSALLTKVGFGATPNFMSGYAMRSNERLGNFDLSIENTGSNPLYFQLKEQSTPSGGWVNVGPAVNLVPRGTQTVSYAGLVSKKIGLFGSGNTTANIGFGLRPAGVLTGASLDLIPLYRPGWTPNPDFNSGAFSPVWGDPTTLL